VTARLALSHALLLGCALARAVAAAPPADNDCRSVGAMLDDEARVRAYVAGLRTGVMGPGVALCDGSMVFRGWVRAGLATGSKRGQTVYLFRDAGSLRAVAWVAPDGIPLRLPHCWSGHPCRGLGPTAFVISGNVWAERRVRPGGPTVIVQHPPRRWLPARSP
jgi:hypothetical protein